MNSAAMSAPTISTAMATRTDFDFMTASRQVEQVTPDADVCQATCRLGGVPTMRRNMVENAAGLA